ncbi:MAG: carbamate kinase [Candidatus Eisenbacteria bacterium]|nr:carbamate kinase [Candidatus Eisenbacteria bacterium]
MSGPVVVSLGGNALIPGKKGGRIDEQFKVTEATMCHVVHLLRAGEEVVITHGNGPIVGNIVIRNEAAAHMIPPTPLYICGADSQGGIGYMAQQVLRNLLHRSGIEREVVTVVTQVVVDREDPGFHNPTKPIGPFYTQEEARALGRARGWTMMEDAGRGWRHAVASPEPLRIVEIGAIRTLVSAGHVVIAAGGGGVPVIEVEPGIYEGVEAVIDKDLASVVLGQALGAKRLLIVTSVDQVMLHYRTERETPLPLLSLEDAKRYHEDGHFPPGNMGPKILSAIRFLDHGGEEVLITSPDKLADALAGKAGTRIVP